MMCGIAGIVGRVDEENRIALSRMMAAMVHRGPDGSGSWESSRDTDGWGVLLGHRRLAILDEDASQPIVDEDTDGALIVDGRISNHRAIREALGGQEGIRSDGAEVLSRLLATQGAAALPTLRGMFALARWDGRRRSLLLARDPLGVKPLYLARNRNPSGNWTIAFASEVRALLASGLLGAPLLDPEAVGSYVWNGYLPGPSTMIRGIEQVGPGTKIEWPAARGGTGATETYWTLPSPRAEPSTEEEVASLLEEGVALNLESAAPLAIFLSSGIDSSVVANLAQRASSTPLRSFTLAFEEGYLNEGPAARRIAEAIGTQHQEVVLTEADFLEGLEEAVDHLDQPSFDGLNTYFISRAVHRAGCKVVLAGSGGDELFGGYPTFRALPTLHRWGRRTRWIPSGLLRAGATLGTSFLRRSAAPIPPQTRWAKLPDLATSRGDLGSLFQLSYSLFLPGFQRELLGEAPRVVQGLPRRFHERLEEELVGRSPLAAVAVLEQRLTLGQRILRDGDNAGMAVSVEQRTPLVDPLLLDAIYRLPDSLRFHPLGRKAFLRRIGLRGLDPALFERPKAGFVMPFEKWIRRGLQRRMDEVLRDGRTVAAAGLNPSAVERLWQAFLQGAPGVHWSRAWAIYILVRWCARNGVQAEEAMAPRLSSDEADVPAAPRRIAPLP